MQILLSKQTLEKIRTKVMMMKKMMKSAWMKKKKKKKYRLKKYVARDLEKNAVLPPINSMLLQISLNFINHPTD